MWTTLTELPKRAQCDVFSFAEVTPPCSSGGRTIGFVCPPPSFLSVLVFSARGQSSPSASECLRLVALTATCKRPSSCAARCLRPRLTPAPPAVIGALRPPESSHRSIYMPLISPRDSHAHTRNPSARPSVRSWRPPPSVLACLQHFVTDRCNSRTPSI